MRETSVSDAPLQIEFASTGSVGVTHAAMTRHSRKLSPGMRPQINKEVMNHAAVMIGPSSVARDNHSLRVNSGRGTDGGAATYRLR